MRFFKRLIDHLIEKQTILIKEKKLKNMIDYAEFKDHKGRLL